MLLIIKLTDTQCYFHNIAHEYINTEVFHESHFCCAICEGLTSPFAHQVSTKCKLMLSSDDFCVVVFRIENLTIVNLDYTYPTSLGRRVVYDDRGHSDKLQVYGVCGTRQCLLST